MESLLIHFSQYLTIYIIVPFMFLIGIYLTFRLKFLQFTRLSIGIKHLLRSDKKDKGSISNFQAISAVLAGNLGTGNISGMAVAIALGGPGSLFWMWFMAILGSIIKYAGCFLGFRYRIQNKEKEYVGGPMYYLSRGLKSRFLAVLFSIFCIITALITGNFVQVNSILLPLEGIGIDPFTLGIVLAFLVGIVILGGILRFARVVEVIVPLMAFIYLVAAIIILFLHYEKIPSALNLIFKGAFEPISMPGGVLGYGIFYALSSGFKRGIFATDAGVGIAPILQSGAKEQNPVSEGLVALTAPLFVLIICTMTFLVLLVTNAWTDSGMESTNMCVWAFENGLSSKWGGYIIILSLFFFAFTTILAWSTAAGKAVEFLFGTKGSKLFQYFFILFVPIGALLESRLLWTLADISMAFMLIINLIAVIGLSPKIIHATLNTNWEEA